MPASTTLDLTERLTAECATLSPEKQVTVLDFILFMKHTAVESPGDADWERLIADGSPRPKLEAYLKSIAGDEVEVMDMTRL